MARPLRIEFAGALYHVTSRGDGRDDIHLGNEDRNLWLEVVGQVCERFNWVGHAFQGRYKAVLVQKDVYLLELSRYIVLNPARARMTRTVRDWPWSNYRATAGMMSAPKWLETDWILAAFAKRKHEAQTGYRQFAAEGKNQPSPWEDLWLPEAARGPGYAHDRDIAILQAYRSGSYSMRAIGDHIGLHYSTISRIISLAEKP